MFKNQGFSGYADMFMTYFNFPVQGHMQEFFKETSFCNCY